MLLSRGSAEMTKTVLKIGASDCCLCNRMAVYDEDVCKELNLNFKKVYTDDAETWLQYKYIIDELQRESCLYYPTYIILDTDDEYKILSNSCAVKIQYDVVAGGSPKGNFRNYLKQYI